MNTEYLYPWNKSRYETIAQRSLKKKETLSETIIEGGFLLPNRYGPNRMFGYGGVADAKGNYVRASEMNTYAKYVREPVSEEIQICLGPTYEINVNGCHPYIDGDVVYLGYINNHWGHLLIDYSTRLWYFLKTQNKNLTYAYLVDEEYDFHLGNNARRFFELLGIADRLVFINQTTRCKRIILPEPSYITNGYYTDEHLAVFQTIADQVDCSRYPNYETVYYGRQNFQKAKASEVGEELLVDLYKKNGATILAPETMTLDEQIATIRNTDNLAGLSGSLGHNLLFAKPGQKMTIFNKTHNVNMAQMDVDYMVKSETTYVDAYLAKFPVLNGEGPFLIHYSEQLKAFVKEWAWEAPGSQYVSESMLVQKARQHEKSYRQKHINDVRLIYEKDSQYFDYFAPEHLMQWGELLYHLEQPITSAEQTEHLANRVRNKAQRILHS